MDTKGKFGVIFCLGYRETVLLRDLGWRCPLTCEAYSSVFHHSRKKHVRVHDDGLQEGNVKHKTNTGKFLNTKSYLKKKTLTVKFVPLSMRTLLCLWIYIHLKYNPLKQHPCSNTCMNLASNIFFTFAFEILSCYVVTYSLTVSVVQNTVLWLWEPIYCITALSTWNSS